MRGIVMSRKHLEKTDNSKKSSSGFQVNVKYCIIALFSSALLAFGLYNVHAVSGVTEGGGLGLTLLLQHWFHISPAISGFIFNVICYAFDKATIAIRQHCFLDKVIVNLYPILCSKFEHLYRCVNVRIELVRSLGRLCYCLVFCH